MKQNRFVLWLCVVLLFACTGCASFLEKEYTGIHDHALKHTDPNVTLTPIEVTDYEGLEQEIAAMIAEHTENCLFRFSDYTGDPTVDVSNACMNIGYQSPLGAYAVQYIDSKINMIVSYYEAEITISYKKTAEQINHILEPETIQDLKDAIYHVLEAGNTYLAFRSSLFSAVDDTIQNYVQTLYYTEPELMAMLPDIVITQYGPEFHQDLIVEVEFNYSYLTGIVNNRRLRANEAAKAIAKELQDMEQGEALLTLCSMLADDVVVDRITEQGDYSRQNTVCTAYGALVENRASSEGFAMAYKMICNQLGYECYVVNGKYSSHDHAWNIVEYDGFYYHIDVSKCSEAGIQASFFLPDSALWSDYWWNADTYVVCDGPLNYFDIAGSIDLGSLPEVAESPEPAESPETTEPENPDTVDFAAPEG